MVAACNVSLSICDTVGDGSYGWCRAYGEDLVFPCYMHDYNNHFKLHVR